MTLIIDIDKRTSYLHPLRWLFVFIGKSLIFLVISPFILIKLFKTSDEDKQLKNTPADFSELIKTPNLTVLFKDLKWSDIPKSINHLDYDDSQPGFQFKTIPPIYELQNLYFKNYSELDNKLLLIASNSRDKNIDSLYSLDLSNGTLSHMKDFEPFYIVRKNEDPKLVTIWGEKKSERFVLKIASS